MYLFPVYEKEVTNNLLFLSDHWLKFCISVEKYIVGKRIILKNILKQTSLTLKNGLLAVARHTQIISSSYKKEVICCFQVGYIFLKMKLSCLKSQDKYKQDN